MKLISREMRRVAQFRGPPKTQRRRATKSALQRLQEALQELSKEERYDTLQALPPAVKAALLSHMEWAKFCGTAGAATDASLSRGGSGGSVAPLRHQRNGRSGRSVTVQRKRGGWVARLTLLPYLSVSTRCAQTSHQASRMLQVLNRAKDLVLHHEGCEAQSVYQALNDACGEHQISLTDLSLSFCATVGAERLVGCSISGKYSTCLEDVLQQRHLLLQGRAEGYEKLREACQKVLLTTVRPRTSRVFGRARPKALESPDAERLLRGLDRRRRNFCQKRALQVVKRAVRVLEVLLACESRANMADAKRKAQDGNREAERLRR